MKQQPQSVFEQAGLVDALERERKTHLAMIINDEISCRGLTQIEASAIMGIPQPRVSMLRNYRLDHFSVERLLDFLASLGMKVEISVTRQTQPANGHVTIRVLPAETNRHRPKRRTFAP